jgi:hypothetical protein
MGVAYSYQRNGEQRPTGDFEMAYETFQTRREELYNLLDAANHSVSYTAHLMEIDPSDKTIAGYEAALDYAAKIRGLIGENADAEDAKRLEDACIVRKETAVESEMRGFDLAFVIARQNERALP